jgi:hypothetical protein
MEKLMQCSDQCYGEIGSRPPTMIGGLVVGFAAWRIYGGILRFARGPEKPNDGPERWQRFPEKIMFEQRDEIMIRFRSHRIVI